MWFKVFYILTYPITLFELLLVWLYRKLLRHALPKSCHFMPTCSEYAFLSIQQFGWLFGSILAIKRIVRCRPNQTVGIDYPKLNLLGNYKWKC